MLSGVVAEGWSCICSLDQSGGNCVAFRHAVWLAVAAVASELLLLPFLFGRCLWLLLPVFRTCCNRFASRVSNSSEFKTAVS